MSTCDYTGVRQHADVGCRCQEGGSEVDALMEKCTWPHLLKCLENKGITQFPNETRSNAAGVILTTKTAALHCLC